jgi:hypothetical protein
MDRTILNIRRRLERWELSHLQALAAAQAEEIDTLRAEVERLKLDVERAEDEAWNAHRMSMLFQDIAYSDRELAPAITTSGEVFAIQKGA